jgi:hypothetical protein
MGGRCKGEALTLVRQVSIDGLSGPGHTVRRSTPLLALSLTAYGEFERYTCLAFCTGTCTKSGYYSSELGLLPFPIWMEIVPTSNESLGIAFGYCPAL